MLFALRIHTANDHRDMTKTTLKQILRSQFAEVLLIALMAIHYQRPWRNRTAIAGWPISFLLLNEYHLLVSKILGFFINLKLPENIYYYN